MTKKHFKIIANIIDKNTLKQKNHNYILKNNLVNDLCVAFSGINPLFDWRKFENACNDTINNL